MATALYRLNGLEVVRISAENSPFASRDTAYFGVLTNPALPDGTAVREVRANNLLGPMRVLGFAKIAVPATNTVRNATQAEIDTFAAAEDADINNMDVDQVKRFFTEHPQWRKAYKALLRRFLQVTNAEAEKWNDFRAQVAAATSLADLKTRVAALGDLPTFTVAQAVTALLSDILADD